MKIEDSEGHDVAYNSLVESRFRNTMKAKDLGDPDDFLRKKDKGGNEEEMIDVHQSKQGYLAELREATKDKPEINAVVDDIEVSLEKAR